MVGNKNKKIQTRWSGGILAIIFVAGFFIVPFAYGADNIGEINEKISDRQKEVDILQKEIEAYREQIKEKQGEAKSLQNQIAILDNEIAKINLDILASEKRIEQTGLEIQRINIEITETKNLIEDRKEKISEYIRLINRQDEISVAEIVLAHNSFSEFFDQVKYAQEIHGNLNNALGKLKTLNKQLEDEKVNWQKKADLEQQLKTDLQEQRASLEERTTAQRILQGQAKLTAKQYQNYAYQLQLEQQQINADIITMEREVRQKLADRDKQERFKDFGPARLSWPVDPGRGVSAYFHDPDYPFRYIFEHSAVDIRAAQGTDIRAPESGYVARVQFKGDASYAYVMLIHNDGLSTVYGHVSKVFVKTDEYVTKGQIIAKSGATPKTPGAGSFTTGPHLHFEVRLNGIPVNPLEYLPAL